MIAVYSQVGMQALAQISNEDLVREQGLDPVIAWIIQLYCKNQLFKSKVTPDDSPAIKVMLRHRWQLVMQNGLLYWKIQSSNRDRLTLQHVLPEAFQRQALWACRKNISNLGKEHSLDFLRDRCYWPNLASDVEAHIHQCDNCQWFKAKPWRTELSPIKVKNPLELVCMDFLTVDFRKE